MQELKFNVEFKNSEAKNLFLNIEQTETEKLTVREQIEDYKLRLPELLKWTHQEKLKSRNRQLIRNGLHPIV